MVHVCYYRNCKPPLPSVVLILYSISVVCSMFELTDRLLITVCFCHCVCESVVKESQIRFEDVLLCC